MKVFMFHHQNKVLLSRTIRAAKMISMVKKVKIARNSRGKSQKIRIKTAPNVGAYWAQGRCADTHSHLHSATYFRMLSGMRHGEHL